MKLTRNEKRILKLLLNNSRISDKEISARMNISSQAVGKIRKKLEATVIDSYTVKLDCCKLDVNLYAMAVAKLTRMGTELGEKEVEKILRELPHVIHAYRLSGGTCNYIIMYGFRDMEEMDRFFRSQEMKGKLHDFIQNKELFAFPYRSLVKNDPMQLFNKIMDESPNRVTRFDF